jgi:ribosome maturation factor RimP
MELSEQIRELAESLLAEESHFIVDVEVSLKGNPKKLLVTVDGDQGIGIDDCATLSRALSKALDDSNLVEDAFVLEVSTPGLDQPLKIKRQYVRNIGRKVKVKTKEQVIEGQLTEVDDNKIQLLQQTGTGKNRVEKKIEILFQDIDKTLVLVSFK